MSYDLRWYQREACDAVYASLCSESGNPLIELPTGSGKSLVIAEVVRLAVQQWGGRVICLAHRKELLEQNAEKIKALLPLGITAGIYSAGLRRYATDDHVILAGIQSVYKKAADFGRRQLVVIDESHLVPCDGEGMYRRFLDDLRTCNPDFRVVGLTATPFRTDSGELCGPDRLFQRICYSAPIPRLIADGFLSPVTSRPADNTVDTSKLHVRGGEFVAGEMEALFDGAELVAASCREIVAKTADRKSVLIFCAGISHAEHVAKCLGHLTGETVGLVTGGTTPLERSATLTAFKNRELRFLCNVDVLTTGFDAPCIDAIAVLRATQSAGLFAQICGRGFRLYPTKVDCVVLDFGENIKRHGPLDSKDYGRRMQAPRGEAVEKVCPNCELGCAAGCAVCPSCGFAFPPREPRKPNHNGEADHGSDLLTQPPSVWIVEEVNFVRHRKSKAQPGDPDTLRVDYLAKKESGSLPERISEWVCMDHPEGGYAYRKACQWWGARSKAIPEYDENNSCIDSCINWWKRGAVATPSRITAVQDGKFWRITGQELDPIPEPDEWQDESVLAEPELFEDEDIPF